MNHRFSFACVLFAVSFLAVSTAWPEDRSGSTGIGFIVGEPTGVSLKHFLTPDTAIDVGAAWSLVEDSHFHIHADYLFHNFNVLKREFDVSEGELPLYYGIGGRVRFDHDARAGIRIVLGVSYRFEEAPLDLFFEVAPIMDLVPETELNGNVGMGIRFWFR
jgi:hypothetical protein